MSIIIIGKVKIFLPFKFQDIRIYLNLPLNTLHNHKILTHPCRHHKLPIKWMSIITFTSESNNTCPTSPIACIATTNCQTSQWVQFVDKSEVPTRYKTECYRNVIFPINKPFIGIYCEITTLSLLFQFLPLSVSRNANYRFYYYSLYG